MPTGLGDEQLWLSATNDNTGTSTAFQDQSGNGNNGTASGTLVVADTSEGGSFAYDFDGVNDYIDLGSVLTGSGDFTISAWFNTNSSSFSYIYGKGVEGVGGDGIGIAQQGSFYGAIGNNGTRTVLSNSGTTSTSTWHHYAVTFDRDGLATKYVGGVQIGTDSITASAGDIGTDSDYIGRFGSNSTGFFDGKIDDVRAYNRTLTQAEITHLAEARGIEGPPPVGLGDEQLWLCPSLNDSANDISGNGNDGTYNGGMGTVADTSNGGSLAFDFDGTDDYIDVVSSGVPAAAYSVSIWQYSTRTAVTTAFNAGDATSKRTVNIDGVRAATSNDSHGHQSSGTFYLVTSTAVRSSATWYHYLLTYDGSTLRLYVDGVLVGSLASVPNTTYTETKCWIGQYIGNGYFFQGRMDDIRAYNRTLTQSEITHLASQRGVEGPPPIGLGDEQLWLCPSLNDSANDISGSGNDGTYQGGMGTALSDGKLAFNFDGTDDYIDCGDTLEGSVGGTDSAVTYSSWMKLDSYSNNNNGLGTAWMGKCDNVGNGGPALNSINGKIDLARFPEFSDGGSSLISTTDVSQVPLSTWKHVAVTYSGCETTGCTSIFIDGVAVSITETESNYGSGMPDNARPFTIGTTLQSTQYKRMMNGLLDDIRVYNRVLTQAEITHLATSRGIEGSPSGPTAQYNAFLTHAFKQLFQTRLR